MGNLGICEIFSLLNTGKYYFYRLSVLWQIATVLECLLAKPNFGASSSKC